MIAQVVASERALAQTVDVAMHGRGCRTTTHEIINELEVIWKDTPQRVTAPYR